MLTKTTSRLQGRVISSVSLLSFPIVKEDEERVISLNHSPLVQALVTSPEYSKIFENNNGLNFCRSGQELCYRLTKNPECQIKTNHSETIKMQNIIDWYYQDFIKNNQNLNLCCLGNTACSKYLKEIPLEISADNEIRQMKGKYDFFNKKVLISDRAIQECTTLECLQEIILHEMGHACQAASFESYHIITQKLNSIVRFFKVTGEGILTSAFAGYEMNIGPSRRNCIMQALQNAKNNLHPNSSIIEMSWIREAFADAIFAPMRASPLHWRQSCELKADETHADRKEYLHCLFIKD